MNGKFQETALNLLKIDEGHFKRQSPEEQNWLIMSQANNVIEILITQAGQCQARKENCDGRFEKLQKPASKLKNILALTGLGIFLFIGTAYAIGFDKAEKFLTSIGKFISWLI